MSWRKCLELLIQNEINNYYKSNVNIIDSPNIVAKYIEKQLRKDSIQNNKKQTQHHFYVSNYTKSFEKSAKLFFKDVVIWGTIVSVVAIAAIMANYYLLEKYDSAFVTPIAESVLLIFNAIFSVWILGEEFTSDMGIGLGCIVLGIFFIYREKLKLF